MSRLVNVGATVRIFLKARRLSLLPFSIPTHRTLVTRLPSSFRRVLECPELSVGKPSSSLLLPPGTRMELARKVNIDDANPNGNVHGGVMLQMMEQAGEVVANRHCNNMNNPEAPVTAILVRVDHIDFHWPMFLGEVCQIQAAVTYTSRHSIEVTVDAWAENMLRGHRRHTNSATLWYITTPVLEQLDGTKDLRVVPVPQLSGLTREEEEAGKLRYELQKQNRAKIGVESFDFGNKNEYEPTQHTVLASQHTLANVVLPSDCTITGHLMGGAVVRKMDDVAALTCASHCSGGLAVTACIDTIDFHSPITCREVLSVTSRLSYVSSKSMEIEVIAETKTLSNMAAASRVTTTAFFTYVALGDSGQAKEVPKLELRTNAERKRFKEGRIRYEARRKGLE